MTGSFAWGILFGMALGRIITIFPQEGKPISLWLWAALFVVLGLMAIIFYVLVRMDDEIAYLCYATKVREELDIAEAKKNSN